MASKKIRIMKKFKIGDRFINNIDHSMVSSHGYDHVKNYKQFTNEPDDSLETIGKSQVVIDIDDDMIITDFILSSGENFSFESGSPYGLNCIKIK
jgi:hypothetical protein